MLSILCVDRAVPIWGKADDGRASDKTLNTPLLSKIAQLLACHGVAPGAYIYTYNGHSLSFEKSVRHL